MLHTNMIEMYEVDIALILILYTLCWIIFNEMGTQPDTSFANNQTNIYQSVSQADKKYNGSLDIFQRGLIEDHVMYEDVMYR